MVMLANGGFFPEPLEDFLVMQSGAAMQLLKNIVLNPLSLLSKGKIDSKR